MLDVVALADFAGDQLVYLTYSEPCRTAAAELALGAASWSMGTGAARGLHGIWHDPAGGEGGQFGGVVAFAPDGNRCSCSGERQRFTPAQDPSQPLGKILHLTLDGKPAPGNPGRAGAARRSPIRPRTPRRRRARRRFTWPGPNLTPAETWTWATAIPTASPSRPTAGCGRPRWARGRRRAQPDPAGQQLRLAAGLERQQLRRRADSPTIDPGDGFEPPKVWWVPSISPTSLLIYTGDLFPQWKGDALSARCRARR